MRNLGPRIATVLLVGIALGALASCENLFRPGLGDKIDLNPPTVTIDTHSDGEYLTGTVAFGGAFGDDQEGAILSISTDGGDNFTEVSNQDAANGVWSHEIDTAELADAEYEVRVRVTDVAGKETDAKVLVYFDNTAPTVLLRSPGAVDSTLFNQTMQVSGDVYDPLSVTEVRVSLYDANDDQLYLRETASGLSEAQSNGEEKSDLANGTNSWTYPLDTTLYTGGIADFSLRVTAIDRAGNTSSTFFHRDTLLDNFSSIPTVNDLYQAQHGSGAAAPLSTADLSSIRQENLPFQVDQDQDSIQFSFSQPSDSVTTLGQDPVASGTLEDDDGIRLSTVEIMLDGELLSGTAPKDAPASDWQGVGDLSGSGTSVNWAFDLGGFSQGEHSLAIRAEDDEGGLYYSPAKDFAIDYGAPTVSEADSGFGENTEYISADTTLGGVFSDGFGIDSLELRYVKDGAPSQVLDSFTFPTQPTSDTWSSVLDVSALGDGFYEIVIEGTDALGSTAAVNRSIVIDTTSPTLEVTSPSTDELVDGTSYTIRGKVTDESGRGVQTLEYSLNSTDGVDGDWTEVADPSFNWSVAGVDFSGGGEGAKTLWVRASDGLNPVSAQSVSFSYDTSAPALSEDAIGTDAQVIQGSDFSLSGEVDDSNAISTVRIDATKDGVDQGEVYNQSPGTLPFSYSYDVTLPGDGSSDDLWIYTIRVTDGGGRELSLDRTVLIDETAPAAPSLDPFAEAYQVNGLAMSGSAAEPVADEGSGIGLVEYRVNGTPWSPANGTASWYKTVDIGATGLNLSEGAHTLYVRATDRAGNISAEVSQLFTVDRANPTLTVDPAYDEPVYRPGEFTITGELTDTVGLPPDAVTVTVENPAGDPVDLSGNPTSYDDSGYDDSGEPASGAATWGQTVPVGDGDGTYVVTVAATDGVGRQSQVSRNVLVDTTAPSLSGISLSNGDLIQNDSFTVNGTASDAGTGVASVEYRLNGGSWTAANGTSSWSVSLAGLADGLNQTLDFRTTDNAGQVSSVETRSFDVDLATPVLTETTSGIGTVSTVYRNGDVDLGGTATDGNGITSLLVEYSLNGASTLVLDTPTVGAGGAWSASLPISTGDGAYEVTIIATDGAGRTETITYNIYLDSVSPTAEYTAISPVLETNTVNGKVEVRGAVGDDVALDTVEWALLPGATTPTDGDYTAVSGSRTSPVFDVDTTSTTGNVTVNGSGPYDFSFADEATSTLWLRGYDRAGNSVEESQDLHVSQASDRPTISFSTIDAAVNSPADSFRNLIESNGLLRFTLSDDDSVDASSIEISVGDDVSWETINYEGAGTAPADAPSVTTGHDLYDPSMLGEGTTLFYLRVSDDAGEKDGLSAVQEQAGPIYIMVDRNFPTITEDSLGGNVYRSGIFDLSGDLGDTNALENLTVTEAVDGGTAAEVLNSALTGTSDTWTLTNMPDGGAADGVYEYTMTVTDASSKTTVLTRTVTIDTTPPDPPTVATPASGAWLNSSTFNFSGSAPDNGDAGTTGVFYTETARGATPPAKGDAAWESAAVDSAEDWVATVDIAAAGERDFHVYAVDDAGNDGNILTHPFGLDQAVPSVAVNGGTTDTAFVGGDFTIDGSFGDASGLSAVSVETSTDGSTYTAADPANAGFDNGAGSWSWTRSVSGQPDGTYFYRFSFTDNAGNTAQVTKSINLDTVAPVVTFDDTAPSISFDGGAQTATANGTMELLGSVNEDQGVGNLAALEYRVDGGSYSPLSVGNNFAITGIDTTVFPDLSSVPIDLRASDKNGNNSTETFTLNIDQATDKPVVSIDSPSGGDTLTNVNVTVSGTITDDDGVSGDPGTVEYRYSQDGGTTWGSWLDFATTGTETSRNINLSIETLSDGAKAVEIRAVDLAGTASDVARLDFIMDTAEPEFTGLTPADDTYFNGDFSVSGTVSDDSGNVDELEYRVFVDGTETTAWTSIIGPGNTTSSETFNQTIDTTPGTGTYEVFLRATDSNSIARERSISVLVDKDVPSASFVSPGADPQNNIISLTGSSGDNPEGGVSDISFFVVDSGGTEHSLADAFTGTDPTVSGSTSWTISDFDTRDAGLLSYAEDLGGGLYELRLRAVVTDVAGNVGSTAGGTDLTFQIDQAGDRPLASFDQIATDGSSTVTSTTLTGTVTDDDGVDSIVVETWNAGNTGATPDTTESVALTSGSYGGTDVDWRVVLGSAGNGLRGIRVRVVDTVDNNGADYSAGDYSRTDTGRIDFRLDTELPDVAVDTPAANITWSSNNSFDVSGTSGDETGVTALAYKLDDNDFSSGSTPIPAPYDNWSFTIPQGDLADGGHTIYIQATDSVGNTRVASRQISVDKTAPTIGITAPANGSDVSGPVTIGGTAADNAGGAGVDSISVGLGKQIDPGDLAGSTWQAVPGTTSWSFDFANINDYANSTYSTNTGDLDGDGIEDAGETWTDLWDFTFYVRAIDKAGEGANGNTGYLTSYTLTIDPKQDRPEVNILSPDDGSTVGGFVRVFGSAFDGQFIDKVQIAIDGNNNGDYSDDTWTEGTLDETAPDGTNWYLADGDTSWSINLNENSEFDPSGDGTRTIGFKVRAWDYKTTPGDGIPGAAEEYSITFNKSFPRFEAMSLSSGETVGGVVTLSGIVRDETDLDRIIFSNEGPLLDNTVIYDNPDPTGEATPGATTTTVQTTPNPYGGADVMVELIGTGDPDYDVNFPGSYRISIPIDTEAPGLYLNGAGSMSVEVTAEDVTTPSPFTNQNLISFNVDNVDPSDLSYTGDSEIIGTSAELRGTVRDTGTVSGIERLVVYMTNGAGELIRLQNGTGTIASFTEAEVLDAANTAFDDYRMIIDNRLEEGNDGGAAGDADGIPEFLTISAGTYNWSGLFDSSLVADGAVTVNYVAEDFAGNSASGSTAAFVANNKPTIDSIVLGTDLDNSGSVEAAERTSPITGGFSATGYTARNGSLYIGVNASGGNGTLRYSVFHEGAEQNATLTDSTLVIDTTGFPDSGTDNDKDFVVEVYDSTTSDNADKTDELVDTVTLSLTIDNVDETPPSISVAPFGQRYNESSDDSVKALQGVAAYEDNLAVSGDTRLGHVEYATDSLHDGADADLSGTVIFKGKVEDNQNISRISATIPGFNGGAPFDVYDSSAGGAQSGADWAFTIDGSEYLTDDNGNVFNWNFEWNTASLANVVGNNVSVTFTVYDGNSTPNSAADTLAVDVVPYISGIVRPDGEENTYRSRLGKFVIREGEASGTGPIEIRGFNLATTGTAWIRVSNSGATANDEVTTASYSANPGSTILSITDSTAIQHSGLLSVSVNGIESINNRNADTRDWHKEDDGSGLASSLWTDDRYVQVWNYEGAFDGSNSPVHPSMEANRTTWQLWASWSYYATSSLFSAAMGPTQARDSIFSTYDPPEWTDIHVDDGNGRRIVALRNYYNGGTTWGNLVTYEEPAGDIGFIEDLGDDNADTPNYADGEDEQLYQFRNPRIAYDPVNTRNYVSYYDAYSKTLKYAITDGTNEPVRTGYGNQTTGIAVVDGVEDTTAPPTSTGDDVGLWSSIAVDASGGADATAPIPVIMYYDSTNATLKIARGLDSEPQFAAEWSITEAMLPDDPNRDTAGYYVDMKLDASGNVHAVAYRVSTGDLLYLTAPNVDGGGGTYTFGYSEIVDSEGAVGSWADLDLVGSTPYISYLSGNGIGTFSGLKMAYYDTGAGEWEHSVVATNSIVDSMRTSIVARPTSGPWVTSTRGKVAIGYGGGTYNVVILEDEE